MAGRAGISLSAGVKDAEKVAAGAACVGCLPDLLARYDKAGGRFMVCPVCFNAGQLGQGGLLPSAKLAGSVRRREWIGGEGAATFGY
jgi:hypothetical protein